MMSLTEQFITNLFEFKNPRREADINFVKGKRQPSEVGLRQDRELAFLFYKELQRLGHNPDKLASNHINNIYELANPGNKKHLGNMKTKKGDEWYKPKNGFGFSGASQLKHVKHIVLTGDTRLIITKLRDGTFDYAISNHGKRGSSDYQHVLDYVKKVRGTEEEHKAKVEREKELEKARKEADARRAKAQAEKMRIDRERRREEEAARKKKEIAKGRAKNIDKIRTQRKKDEAELKSFADKERKEVEKKRVAIAKQQKKDMIAHEKEQAKIRAAHEKEMANRPKSDRPKWRMDGMAPEKAPSAFQRLKSTLGMK